MSNGYPGHYGHVEEPVEHRGLVIERYGSHRFWRIRPRPGYYLPRAIDGAFTKLDLAQSAIDEFFKMYPEANSEVLWEPVQEEVKRGRPPTILDKYTRRKKALLALEEQEQEQEQEVPLDGNQSN